MPYKDPEKQKAAKRASAQRSRQRQGRQRVAVAVAEAAEGLEHVLPEPPERDELIRLLGIQARSGSVRAIELMLKMEAPVADANTDPLDGLDELAAKRAVRA